MATTSDIYPQAVDPRPPVPLPDHFYKEMASRLEDARMELARINEQGEALRSRAYEVSAVIAGLQAALDSAVDRQTDAPCEADHQYPLHNYSLRDRP